MATKKHPINQNEQKFVVIFNNIVGVQTPHKIITELLPSTGDKFFTWATYITDVFFLSCGENSYWDVDKFVQEIMIFTPKTSFLVIEIKNHNVSGFINKDFWKWWTNQRDVTLYRKERLVENKNKARLEKIHRIKEVQNAKHLKDELLKREEILKRKNAEITLLEKKKTAERQEANDLVRRSELLKREEDLLNIKIKKLSEPEPEPVPEPVPEPIKKVGFFKKYFNIK